MEFNCIQDCAQCCIEREYYPTKKFGKIGVLILAEEKESIKKLAKENRLKITILPRIGISEKNANEPTQIIAYQLMGKEQNGNTCPFLDKESEKRSPHGGFTCKIYKDRPLACRAYPVIGSNPITLDKKCKFCTECGQTDKNLNSEIESLIKIKTKMDTNSPQVWRYATGVGEESDRKQIETGWRIEQ